MYQPQSYRNCEVVLVDNQELETDRQTFRNATTALMTPFGFEHYILRDNPADSNGAIDETLGPPI